MLLAENSQPQAVFPPKTSIDVVTGRSSDLLPFRAFPSYFKQWQEVAKGFGEAYSSGDCSGFSPDSLFIVLTPEPLTDSKYNKSDIVHWPLQFP